MEMAEKVDSISVQSSKAPFSPPQKAASVLEKRASPPVQNSRRSRCVLEKSYGCDSSCWNEPGFIAPGPAPIYADNAAANARVEEDSPNHILALPVCET